MALQEFSSAQYYTVRRANPTDFLPALTSFVRSIVPGIVIVLFCQCMGALLGPTNRKHKTGGIRWGLVALTTVMFLLSTTALALNIRWLSPYCIRVHYYANDTLLLSGPLGYQYHINTLSDIATSIISLNQWLADGLLVSSVSKSVVQAF